MWVSDRVCVAVWDCVNAAAKDNEKFVLVCPSLFFFFVIFMSGLGHSHVWSGTATIVPQLWYNCGTIIVAVPDRT